MKYAFATLALFWVISASTSAANLSVGSDAKIFGAGQATPPGGATFGAGLLPPSFSFAASPGQILRVTQASGLVGSVIGGGNYAPNADGHAALGVGTNISSQQGISGIKADAALFLAGLFLDSNAPLGAPPATLDFTAAGLGESFLALSPQIGQVFFIGDGMNGPSGSGTVQTLAVPATATRLFLGFADAVYDGAKLTGNPDTYTDNVGGLGVAFTIVPEPASATLLAGAKIVFGICSLRGRQVGHAPHAFDQHET